MPFVTIQIAKGHSTEKNANTETCACQGFLNVLPQSTS